MPVIHGFTGFIIKTLGFRNKKYNHLYKELL